MQSKVSVITVVFNSLNDLQQTFESVVNQTYSQVEFIIVDGASTDGTLDFIKQNEKYIQQWVSEKDEGIYDAMNKGLKLASGDFVLFMNAGDSFNNIHVLSDIFMAAPENTDAIYGETIFMDEAGNNLGTMSALSTHKLPAQAKWQDMKYGMVFCHQSFLVKKEIAPPFLLNHLYSADIDWIIKCLKASKNTYNAHIVIAKFRLGGFSQKNKLKSLLDRFGILSQHFGFIPSVFNHIYIVGRAFIKMWQ